MLKKPVCALPEKEMPDRNSPCFGRSGCGNRNLLLYILLSLIHISAVIRLVPLIAVIGGAIALPIFIIIHNLSLILMLNLMNIIRHEGIFGNRRINFKENFIIY